MYIRPATDGAKVPDPAMRGTPAYYLPPEGREVEYSDYWVRRVRDGDVLVMPTAGVDVQADAVMIDPSIPGIDLAVDAGAKA